MTIHWMDQKILEKKGACALQEAFEALAMRRYITSRFTLHYKKVT